MRWKRCELLRCVSNNADRLNNPIYTKETVCQFQARVTPWSTADITNLGREYTAVNRKLLTKLPVSAIINDNTRVNVDGVEYDIDRVIDMEARYRLLYITAYKQ